MRAEARRGHAQGRELDAAKRWFENKWVRCMNGAASACDTVRTLKRLYPDQDALLPQRLIRAAAGVGLEDMNRASRAVFGRPWGLELTVGE